MHLSSRMFAMTAVIVGAAILEIGGGALGLVIPIALKAEGFSPTVIGTVISAHPAGFLIGCLVVIRLVHRVGHIRAFAALAAGMATATLGFTIAPEPWLWALLRVVTGFCSAGLFAVVESWLNDQVPPQLRGRVLGIYASCTRLSLAVGQAAVALLAGSGTAGAAWAIFALCSACFSFSLVPVAVAPERSPRVPEIRRLNPRRLYAIAPVAAIGCLGAGMMNTALLQLSPVYALQVGIGTALAAAIAAVMQTVSMTTQWPLGWLSDKIDRRLTIVGATGGTALGAIALVMLPASAPAGLVVLAFGLAGGLSLSIYALCVAHAFDFVERSDMVGLSSSLLMTWAVGSIVGPMAATFAMEAAGPKGLPIYIAAVALFLSSFALWRMTRRRPVPPPERPGFVLVATTSPSVSHLDPRTRHVHERAS